MNPCRWIPSAVSFAPVAVLLVLLWPGALSALPEDGQVVAGDVTFDVGAGTLDLTQAGNVGIVNWTTFNIGAGEIVNINQDSPEAALLNRVLGADPSALLGQLNAAGRVYLINPNGIVVGRDASINAMEFVASALDVADADFLNGGDLTFAGESSAGVINLGRITAANGDVILIAHHVANDGTITAGNGVAGLAAGQAVILSPTGDQRLLVKTQLPATTSAEGVNHSGVIEAAQAELKAAGGNLYALAINQTGVIRATGVAHRDGRILLTADGGDLAVAGTLAAHDADGSGGEILIGGDFRGANAAVANAQRTTVAAGTLIDVAAASAQADGGRVVVWADQQTDFAGRIDGRAGASGGDGAFAEVSGKRILNYQGIADLSAAAGATGTLLLDPDEAVISTATDDQVNGVFNTGVIETNLATANVIIDTSSGYGDRITTYGDIVVQDAVSWTSANTLSLRAADSITVQANLTGGTGSTVDFALGSAQPGMVDAALTVASGATVTASTVVIRGNPNADPLGNGPTPSPTTGAISFNGVLVTDTLDLALNARGVFGNVSIANAGNQIGTLTTSQATGSSLVEGAFNLVDGSGGLTISGDLRTNGSHAIQISTPGDLTLASGTTLTVTDGAIALASTGGNVVNQAGTSLIDRSGTGRTLIYTGNPDDTALGGLGYAPVYNKTLGGNAPGSITQTGDRVLYRLAPTITFTADSFNRAYGSANPTLTFTATGLVGGDAAAAAFSGTPTLSLGATTNSDVGSYAISTAAGTVAASDYDYQIAFADGALTINPVALSVTAADASRIYGDANPSFTGSITGFVLGQDASVFTTAPTYASTAAATSDVGSYAITGSGAVATNYTFNYTDGTLTVNPAALTITANDKSRDYGDANPTLDVTYSGFKNSDDATAVSGLTVTTAATATSDVGTYAIDAAGGTATNYTITHVDGTLTIDPAAVTVTAADANRTYGATNPTFNGTVTGLKNGQDASVLPNLGYATTATSASDAGTYAITPGSATNPNYTYTYVPGTLTVNPAALTITANNASALFNDPIPTFSASYAGLVNGDTAGDIAGLTLTTTATQGDAVGTYAISAAGATNSNYTISFEAGILTISNQILTITADDFARLYGAANPIFTATTTGFVGSDDLSILTSPIVFTTTADTGSGVGTYTITPSGAVAPNYDITFVVGTLTINPAALTITATDFARTYGDANPVFSASFTGLVAGDTSADISGLVFNTPATNASNVGTYAITPSGASNANYTITQTAGTLTIDPAALTVSLDDQTRTYGDTNPALTSTITGFKLSDTASVLTGLAPTTTATAASDVGTYTITTGAVSATNYTVTVNDGTLTVDPAALTITADDLAKTYGAANPTLTTTATSFKLSDDTSVLTGLTVTTAATTTSDVGTYTITPAGATATNYAITFVPGTLTVSATDLLITAASFTRSYGSGNPTFTATFAGLTAGDTATDISGLLLATSATDAANVGTYAITASGATNPNYNITFAAGTLTVDPAPLTFTAANASKVYADVTPTLTASGSGFVLGHNASDLGGLSVATVIPQLIDAGTYSLTPQLTDRTALASNYTITFNPGTFTVTPRPVSIVASGGTRLYGDANPTFTFSIDGTNPTGATLASLLDTSGVTLSTAATAASPVGNYTVDATGVTDPNFVVTYVPGTLVVNPAPLTITAANAARLYGAVNPDFSATASGLKGSDTLGDVLTGLTLSTLAATGSGVGTYAITATGTALNENYTITFVPGTLSVNPAPLLLVPALSTRVYGDADPAFAVAATGLVNGDTVAVVSNLQFQGPAPTAGVGSHAVTILGATATNYDLSFGAGTMNITPRALTISADDASREYGEANPTFTATFDGLASFDTAAAITGLALSTPAIATSNVVAGGYGLNVTSDANPNYTIGYVAGRLTITPAPLLVELDALTRVYGDANPTPTATIATGFKGTDTAADLSLQIVSTTTPTTDVGTYAYNATTSNPNYALNLTGGTITITPAPLTLQVAPLTRLYGDAGATPTFTLGGLKFAAPLDTVVQVADPTTLRTGVGVYDFSATVLDPNYTITALSGVVTIAPRPLDLVATGERFYGDANPAAAAFALSGNFVNGDNPASIVNLRFEGVPDPSTDVGTYDLTATTTVGLVGGNYLLNTFASSLTIAPRPVFVNLAPVERLYGDANPTFTLVGDSNILPAFDAVEDVLRFIAPDERAVPGNYTVEAEIINPNYTLGSLGFANLTISRRVLHVIVDNVARYFGDANPLFTASLGGHGLPDFVDPTTFLPLSTILATDPTTGVGHYLISARSSAIDPALYDLRGFTPGILSIFPRPVGIQVDDTTLSFAPGTELADVTDFSDAEFTATGQNFVNGDTAAAVFPDLTFAVVVEPSPTPVGVAVDLNTYTPPPLAAFIGGSPVTTATATAAVTRTATAAAAPTVSALEDETVTTEFVPVVIEGTTNDLATANLPLGGEISLGGFDASSLTFRSETDLGTDEVRVTRSVGLAGGYLNANPNYVVTAVTNGVLTLRQRTTLEEALHVVETVDIPASMEVSLRSMSDYTANVGVLFSDYPDMAFDMILSFFDGDGLDDRGLDSLYYAIFGAEPVRRPLDTARIRAWLADIGTNAEKRAAMAGAMVSYLADVQALPLRDRTPGQQKLADVVALKFAEERDRTGNLLKSRLEAFQRNNIAGAMYYGITEEVSAVQGRLASAAQGMLDFANDNTNFAQRELLRDIIAQSSDSRNFATMLGLIDQLIAARADGESAFFDTQLAGFRAELLDLENKQSSLRATLENTDASSTAVFSDGMQGLFGTNVPYLGILGEARLDALDAKLANYDLLGAAVGGMAGGAVAGGLSTAVSIVPKVAKAIFPYLRGGSAAAKIGGVPMAVFTFISGTTERAFQVFQEDEQRIIFEDLVGDIGASLSFDDIDLSPLPDMTAADYDPKPSDMKAVIEKEFLMDAMMGLLVGPTGGEG